MKRLRGACKGCKCADIDDYGVFFCHGKDKKLKKPPRTCDKRIDAATYLENGE